MSETLSTASQDLISYTILVKGQEIKEIFNILTINVNREIGTPGTASFTVLLPDIGQNSNPFEPSESNDFIPGHEVEIKLGYEGTNKTVFKGIISGQRVRVSEESAELVVICQDNALKMTLGSRTKAYEEQTDSAIMSSIISENGLSAEVDETTYKYKQLVQSATSDWDFILNRARVNGLLVYTEGEKVIVKKPDVGGSTVLTLNYGENVYDFDGEIDASFQLPSIENGGWDFTTQEFVKTKSKKPRLNKQGNLAGEKMAAAIGFTDISQSFSTPLESGELGALSDSELLRSRLSMLRGKVSFIGSAIPRLNSLIELAGVGNRFNGPALVTRVQHTVHEGTWKTKVEFGLPPTPSVADQPGMKGLFPGIEGLQNAVVTKIDEDPDKQHRIQVNIPVLDTDVWARQATFYATQGQGAFFVPEVGDEVVVGFLNDDPRFPVILGSLYSSKNKPAYTADEQNNIKAITTRAGLKLEMDDYNKSFTLQTPNQNTVILSDDAGEVTLKDENGNSIVMSRSGIEIKSSKDISIKAAGNIKLEGATGIDGKSSGGDVNLKGMNFTGQGDVAASVKGGAQAELSAGGQTTVKGAMVMIN